MDIPVTMAAVVGLVTAWMKIANPLYTASMVIAPAAEAGAGGLAERLSQYAGLASLAGIELPSGETVSPFTQFTQLVTSVAVAQRLQDKSGVLQNVFECSWDPENERWVPPQGLVAKVRGRVLRFFNVPPWTPPSPASLAEFFENELEFSKLARTVCARSHSVTGTVLRLEPFDTFTQEGRAKARERT